jgi:hypothetical protein
MDNLTENQRVVTPDMLENLPPPVQRYLTHTGVVGYPWIRAAKIKQEGKFRLGADRPWMPFTAEQSYTTQPPSLVWNARFKVAGLPLLRARDRYENAHGHMYGKLAGLLTVFDARGEELDQATMIRYLNEIMWFPTAFLGDNIRWKGIDERSARVTFTDQGKDVSAEMFFDAEGRLTNFKAMRYREKAGEYSLDPWSTPMTGYAELAGLNLPTRGRAVWRLPDGDLAYADLEVTEVEYNPAGG